MSDARISTGHNADGAGLSSSKNYSHAEIRARLADPRLVIGNVLPRIAFEEARIPGSISLPFDDIPARARTVLPKFDQEIALYCGGPT